MKVVILAGGLGSRLAEETTTRPKPMVEIGGRPILWHIMKIYSYFGFNDFIICLGYKGYYIKEYFANYFLHSCDVTINIQKNSLDVHNNAAEPWKVTLVDTGQDTMTGGRLKRVAPHIDETFCMTYGDGVGDINIKATIDFHRAQKRAATVTLCQPPGRFGAAELDAYGTVRAFTEKPTGDSRVVDGGWINAGFFVLEPSVFDTIDGDDCIWERKPLQTLAEAGELSGYRHIGFWKPMDTLRDRQELDALARSPSCPWKRKESESCLTANAS